jgi:hypothetical protein
MSKPLVDRVPFAKIVIILAVSFGIGLGLCGTGVLFVSHGARRGGQQTGFVVFAVVSAGIVILSLVGLVIVLIGWAVAGLLGGRSKPQTLFDDPTEKKHDEDSQL